MAQNCRQSTLDSAESQQTAGSTPPAPPHQSQHGAAQYAPDLLPTLSCSAELIPASHPSYPPGHQPAESAAEQGPNTPQKPQNPAGMQQESMDCEGGVPAQGTCNSPTVILVMGVAGCGKTSFIEKVIGHINPNVAANINHTIFPTDSFRIDSFSAEIDGKQYLFLDTTGSHKIENIDVPETRALCQQLSNTPDINGIIYIHCITYERISAYRRHYLELFETLCGRACMKNVLLLTNHWDKTDPEVGESREKELRDKWWKGMIDVGATVKRLNPTMPESVHSIVEWFSHCAPTPLAIKEEMVHQKQTYVGSSIWWVVWNRILKTFASAYPEYEYITHLKTSDEWAIAVFQLSHKCILLEEIRARLEKERAQLLDELQDYKDKQSKSIG